MNDEMDRLRAVVRALVAWQDAWAKWRDAMNKPGEPGVDFTDEVGEEQLRTASVVADRRRDLEHALTRLAEVAPDLVFPPT